MFFLQRLWQLFCQGWVGVWLLPIEQASLDEMVFEGRETDYGAYQLRRKYPWHLSVATGLIVSVSGTLLGIFLIWRAFVPVVPASAPEPPALTVVMVDFLTPPPPPSSPPKPPLPSHAYTSRTAHSVHGGNVRKAPPEPEFLPPRPVPELTHIGRGNAKQFKGLDGWVIPDPALEEDSTLEVIREEIDWENSKGCILYAEPRPLNLDTISRRIGYPPQCREVGIQGNVVLRILINKKGEYKRHKVVHQAHPLLTAAIEKHIGDLRFEPAINLQGKPIPFWVNVPFHFTAVN